MKYHITPFTIGMVGAILYALYSIFITPSADRKLLIFAVLGFGTPTLALLVGADFLMQKYISPLWLVYTIQLAGLPIWGAYQIFGQAEKKLVIPDAFTGEFIVAVFGVHGTPALPQGRSFRI